MKNRKGAGNAIMWTIAVLLVAGVAMLGIIAFGGEKVTPPTTTGTSTTGGITTGGICSDACPDTLAWSGTVNLYNELNNTGSETFNATMKFYEVGTNTLRTSITNTDSGSLSLTCGKQYNVQVQSTVGAGGDKGVLSDGTGYTVDDNGIGTFNACGSGSTIGFTGRQHGLQEVKAKDMISSLWMHDNQDWGADATDYESTDGVQFFSGTNNTGITVDSGGELNILHDVRANVVDQDVNDLGVYILIDADSTIWDIDNANVKLDGTPLTEASSSLNADEKKSYNAYEAVYLIPSTRSITQNKKATIEFSIFALGGVDPTGSNNLSIDYAPIGRYASTANADVLKVGAVTDAPSPADVHTRFDTVQVIV